MVDAGVSSVGSSVSGSRPIVPKVTVLGLRRKNDSDMRFGSIQPRILPPPIHDS